MILVCPIYKVLHRRKSERMLLFKVHANIINHFYFNDQIKYLLWKGSNDFQEAFCFDYLDFEHKNYILLEKVDPVKYHDLYEFILNYQIKNPGNFLEIFDDTFFKKILNKYIIFL